jgi:hypothetical protein
MAETTYHAPVYEPTVDELEVLKKLEMGEPVSLESICPRGCASVDWSKWTAAINGTSRRRAAPRSAAPMPEARRGR